MVALISPWAHGAHPFSLEEPIPVHLGSDQNFEEIEDVEIPRASRIQIDPNFLNEILGTGEPSEELLLDLVENPKKYERENFKPQRHGFLNWNKSYFYPILYSNKDGELRRGYAPLNQAKKMGHLYIDYYRDPFDFKLGDEPPPLEEFEEDLPEEADTEAESTCPGDGACISGGDPEPVEQIKPLTDALKKAEGKPATALYEEYSAFAESFSRRFRATRGNSSWLLQKFLKELIQTFGMKDSSRILLAITGYGEVVKRQNSFEQVADFGAVYKVIQNRATNGHRTESDIVSSVLRSLGINEPAYEMGAIFSKLQFSAWNGGTSSLVRLLSFDGSERRGSEHMKNAFLSLGIFEDKGVSFLGGMDNPDITHYHADIVRKRRGRWVSLIPQWRRRDHLIKDARIQVTLNVDGEPVTRTVDLNKFKSPKHLFYWGIK